MNYIYALLDPDTNEVRYIGKTNDLSRRLKQHIYDSSNHKNNRYVNRWILSVLNLGKAPKMELIEECFENWADQEIFWIQYYKNKGCKLTNLSDGGEGINIKVRNKEWYRKVVETRRKNGTFTQTREVVEKIRRTNLKRMSEFCRNGHKRTDENTEIVYISGNPSRSCKDCRINRQIKDNKYTNNDDRKKSQKENYKVLKKWHDENGFPTKELCKRGHPLSGDNLRLLDRVINGKHKTERICRQCVRQRNHESKRRKRNGLKNSGV